MKTWMKSQLEKSLGTNEKLAAIALPAIDTCPEISFDTVSTNIKYGLLLFVYFCFFITK